MDLSEKKKFKIDTKIKVLIVCLLIAGGGVGLHNVYNVFVPSILSGLSITQSAYGTLTLVNSIISSLCSFLVVRITVRYGPKWIIALGAAFTFAGYVLLSIAQTPLVFFVSKVVDGFGYGLLGNTLLYLIINQWFTEGSGTATSIVMCFTGIAGTALSPVFASLITMIGWRPASLVLGATVILFCLPFLLFRGRLYSSYSGDEGNGETVSAADENKYPEFSRKSLAFLCLCVLGGASYFVSIMGTYLTSYGLSLGLSLQEASLLLSAGMIGNTVSKLINGALCDRIGAIPTNIVMLLISSSAILLLLTTNKLWLLLVFAFLYGCNYSVAGLGVSMINKETYGTVQFQKVQPIVSFISTLVYAIGNPVWGILHDMRDSYLFPFAACALADFIAVFGLLYLRKFNKKA